MPAFKGKIILLVTGTTPSAKDALDRTKQLYAEYRERKMNPIAPALAVLLTYQELVMIGDLDDMQVQYELIIGSHNLSYVRFVGSDNSHNRLRELAKKYDVQELTHAGAKA